MVNSPLIRPYFLGGGGTGGVPLGSHDNNPPGLFTGLFQLDVPGHKSVNRRNVLGRKSSQNSLTQGNLGSTVFQRPHATLMHLIYKWAIYHLLSGKQKKHLTNCVGHPTKPPFLSLFLTKKNFPHHPAKPWSTSSTCSQACPLWRTCSHAK